MEIATLFADVRGSTGLAERLGAQAFAALLNRYYRAAFEVLVPLKAFVDKMVGDEVVAIFLPVAGPEYRQLAASAAVQLQRAAGSGASEGPWLPLGIGVHSGRAFVGKVGNGAIFDITALGDTMNTAARLQSEAKAGEVVMSEAIYQAIAHDYPNIPQRTLHLRGRDEPVDVRIIATHT